MFKEYPGSDVEKVKLDTKDKKILEILYKNSRTPFSTISRKTGIPKDSVLYRVKRMEKLGVVDFTAILDPIKMGFPILKFVNIVLHNFNPERENAFVGYATQKKNIVYVSKTTGKYDYSLGISAKNLIHFDTVMKSLRAEFSDVIKEFDTVDIIHQYKYDYYIDLIDT